MPLQIVHQDITSMDCDAIVNPTDEVFSGSGGTDLAIHKVAGKGLDIECAKVGLISTGEIVVTSAYDLPCKYVFHTIGPYWEGGYENEAALLRSCYINALLKAKALGLSSIAFPLISAGTFGFPKDSVLRIAINAISDFLFSLDSEMEIYICILARDSFEVSTEIALKEYLSDNEKTIYENHDLKLSINDVNPTYEMRISAPSSAFRKRPFAPSKIRGNAIKPEIDLSSWLKHQDDGFAVALLKLIDKSGMTDVQCYKKANVSKGTFWKINNDPHYKPSKPTVIAFAIALELNVEETEQLLKTAGYSLSNSAIFDKIIQFYIMNENYDIFEINAALFQYDQLTLGC